MGTAARLYGVWSTESLDSAGSCEHDMRTGYAVQ